MKKLTHVAGLLALTCAVTAATAASMPHADALAPATTYVVMLKPTSTVGTAAMAATTDNAITRAEEGGAVIAQRYGALGGFAARMSSAQAEQLRRDPAVQSVTADINVRLADASTDEVAPAVYPTIRPTWWPTNWPTSWPTSRPTSTSRPTVGPKPTLTPTVKPTSPITPRPTNTSQPTTSPTSGGGIFPDADWGLDRVNQRQLPLDRNQNIDGTGEGVHVYVLDTGIRSSHAEFAGRVGNGYDFVNNDSDPNDDHNFISVRGHGSMVASIAAGSKWGVAKKATVHGVKVLDMSGNGRGTNILAGINWVTENGVRPGVVNMSMVADQWEPENEALRRLIGAGFTLVAAAGNDNNDACKRTPAGLPEAITVSASNDKDALALPFANWGPCVDLFAPGYMVAGASNSADNAGQRAQGTSQAAPYVAGAAALYLQRHPEAVQAQVHQAMVEAATPDVIKGNLHGAPARLVYVNGFAGK